MKPVKIIGVPIDLGADRRGVDMGPSAIRYAGLQNELIKLGVVTEDFGNINVPVAESRHFYHSRAKYLPDIVEVSEKLSLVVEKTIADGKMPLVLGGDHSVAIGSIAGVAAHYKKLGVLWVDTHGDFNTPEITPSGNIHGMGLAVALGYGDEKLTNLLGFTPKIRPENTVLLGVRDLDDEEKKLIHKSGVKVFTMKDIDRIGLEKAMEEALKILTNGTDGVHLSFDLDAVDPAYAPGVGTPKSGGLTYREAHLAMELLADADVLVSMDFSEVNPILDVQNKTALLAVELITSALGKRIL